MATRRVALIELPVFPGVVPLASGYMEAYSRKDPAIRDAYEFTKISLPVRTSLDELRSRCVEADADVYAFSCYVWNTRTVRTVAASLAAARPDVRIILGGPQVMHQGGRYLDPRHEQIAICNGEGERTMSQYLRTLLEPDPDLRTVRGISFYAGGTLVTTEPEPRISDLSEIPSPFLEGLFDDQRYRWVLLETNRGCPFKCNYCYWGAAIGGKVFKYEEARVQRELDWISRSGAWYLFIADANWGMQKRDVDLSRLIVDYRRRNGAPNTVYFCGSKNTPDRVLEITQLFSDAGLVTCQSVALQTMNPETLKKVNRDNIRTESYTRVQRSLNDRGISSFVEMIWPLPGETLASFQRGLASLCELGADSFIVYPLLLMNNVELAAKRDEYGLVTVSDTDPNSEAEIVVQTNEVTREEYVQGMSYAYALTSLHTLRGLWYLGRYLSGAQGQPLDTLFADFLRYCQQVGPNPWMDFCIKTSRSGAHGAFEVVGELVHVVLHSARESFDELVEGFAASQPFWSDPVARALVEVDLVARPYIYRNTPRLPKRRQFREIEVTPHPNGYCVGVPSSVMAHVDPSVAAADGGEHLEWFVVDHRRAQLPHMPGKPAYENYLYCHDMSQRMRNVVPAWKALSAASKHAVAR